MKNNLWMTVIGLVITISVGFQLTPAVAQSYTITDLGTLHYHQPHYTNEPFASEAMAVNNLGQVVGNSNGHAFLWSRGKMISLGTLGGANSEAVAINDGGEIVGNSDTGKFYESGDSTNPQIEYHHAFLWRRGKMMDFGNVGNYQGMNSIRIGAKSINNEGQAIIYVSASIDHCSFLYSDGEVKEINDNRSGRSDFPFAAGAINNTSQMAGSRRGFHGIPGQGDMHAMTYTKGSVKDIHTKAQNESSWGIAINNKGDVVGELSNA